MNPYLAPPPHAEDPVTWAQAFPHNYGILQGLHCPCPHQLYKNQKIICAVLALQGLELTNLYEGAAALLAIWGIETDEMSVRYCTYDFYHDWRGNLYPLVKAANPHHAWPEMLGKLKPKLHGFSDNTIAKRGLHRHNAP